MIRLSSYTIHLPAAVLRRIKARVTADVIDQPDSMTLTDELWDSLVDAAIIDAAYEFARDLYLAMPEPWDEHVSVYHRPDGAASVIVRFDSEDKA